MTTADTGSGDLARLFREAIGSEEMRKGVISLALSVPVLTLYLYLFGLFFTQTFYGQMAVPVRVLGFGVTDFVERSWNAFFNMGRTIGVVRPVVVALLAMAVRSTVLRTRWRLATAAVGAIVTLVLWPSGDIFDAPAGLWNWLGAVIVARAALVASLAPIEERIRDRQLLTGFRYLTAGLLVLAIGYALIIGASREGLRFACWIDVNRSVVPVGSILAPQDLGIGRTVPVDEGDHEGWVRHEGLRIYNRVPAGLLVFELFESPRNGMTLIDGDIDLVISMGHDPALAGGQDREPIEPGEGCDTVLSMASSTG